MSIKNFLLSSAIIGMALQTKSALAQPAPAPDHPVVPSSLMMPFLLPPKELPPLHGVAFGVGGVTKLYKTAAAVTTRTAPAERPAPAPRWLQAAFSMHPHTAPLIKVSPETAQRNREIISKNVLFAARAFGFRSASLSQDTTKSKPSSANRPVMRHDSATTKDSVHYRVRKNPDDYFHGRPPGQPLSPREKRELMTTPLMTGPVMIGDTMKLYKSNAVPVGGAFFGAPFILTPAKQKKTASDTPITDPRGWR